MTHSPEPGSTGVRIVASDASGAHAFRNHEYLVVVAPDSRYEDEPFWAAYVALPEGHPFAGLSPDHPILPGGWQAVSGPPQDACRALALDGYAAHPHWLGFLCDDPEEARYQALDTTAVLRRVHVGAWSRQDIAFLLASDEPAIREFARTRLGAPAPRHAATAAAHAPIVEGCGVTEVTDPDWTDEHVYHLLRDAAGRHYLRDTELAAGAARWNWKRVEPSPLPEGVALPPSDDIMAVRVYAPPEWSGSDEPQLTGEYLLLRRGATVVLPGIE